MGIVCGENVFEKKDLITVYVGEDIGQEGGEEATWRLNRLIADDKGRHVMQVNKRIKGRKDNVRLINGEDGFTGAQYANTAKGTRWRNNAEFGSTGTFTAKYKIECGEEILIDYDGNSDRGKYWDVWGKKTGIGTDGDAGGTPSPSPPPLRVSRQKTCLNALKHS